MKTLTLITCLLLFSCHPEPQQFDEVIVITKWSDLTPIVDVIIKEHLDTAQIRVYYPESLITIKKITL